MEKRLLALLLLVEFSPAMPVWISLL